MPLYRVMMGCRKTFTWDGRLRAHIAACLIVLSLGCSGKTKEELLNRGVLLINEKNPRGAIVFLKEALEKDPGFLDARLRLGEAYFHAGRFEQAERELREVLRRRPSLRDARVLFAKCCLQCLRPDEALGQLGGLTGEASTDSEAFELAGLASALKGEYGAAAGHLKKAISLRDGRVSRAALAGVYMEMGQTHEALSLINDMLAKDPSDRMALHIRAEIERRSSEKDAALKTYELILDSYPSDFRALAGKGNLLLEKARYEEALLTADRLVMNYAGIYEGYRLKGILLFHTKDYGGAMLNLQKSISLNPTAGAYYFLGLCHYRKKEFEHALSQLHRALDLDPSFVQARTVVSLILLEQRRMDDAINEIKRVMAQTQGTPLAHDILGSAYMGKGMYEEARNELDAAIGLDPNHAEAYFMKGLAGLAGGKLKEAEAELETALRLSPGVMPLRVVLSLCYMKQNEFGKATDTLLKGMKGAEDDAVLYNLLADVSLQQDDVEGAIGNLQRARRLNPDYQATYFNLALLYFATGRPEGAVRELKEVLEKSPVNLKALLNIAAIEEISGSEGKALEYCLKAAGTGNAEGQIALARFYLRSRRAEDALRSIASAIGKNPSDARLHEFQGSTLLSLGRPADALMSFERLVKEDAKRGLSRVVDAYISMGKHGEALKRVRAQLGKEPGNAELIEELARIYAAMGKKDKAVETAESLIGKYPDSPAGYSALLGIYGGLEDPAMAARVFRRGLAACARKTDIYMAMGDLYISKGKYREAFDAYSRAEESRRAHVPAVFGQGVALNKMGMRQEAEALYLRTLELSSDYVPALNNLAFLYAEEGQRPLRSIVFAARANLLSPGNGPVLDTLGLALLRNRRVGEAINALRIAASLIPGNPTVHYHLALAYREQGDAANAETCLRRAVETGGFPDRDAARRLLSQMETKEERKEKK